MSPPVPFSWPPGPRDGSWTVHLPGSASVGEVIVYAEALGTPPGGGFLRWKCDEAALPLLEISGFNHQLTSATGIELTRPSMRSDGTGHAYSEAPGHSNTTCDWTPDIAVTGNAYTVAMLLGVDTSPVGISTGYLQLAGVMQIQKLFSGFVYQPPIFTLHNALLSEYTVVDTYPGGSTIDANFVAARVDAGGNWKWWNGNYVSSGSFSGYTPTSTTWKLHTFINDARSFKFQELHVWLDAATDAEVEAVRLDLIGV